MHTPSAQTGDGLDYRSHAPSGAPAYRGIRHARLTKSMLALPPTLRHILVELRYLLGDGETRAISNATLARRTGLSEGCISAGVRWLAGEAIAYHPTMKVPPPQPFIERRLRRDAPGFTITMLPPPELRRSGVAADTAVCPVGDHGDDLSLGAAARAAACPEPVHLGDHGGDPPFHDHGIINQASTAMGDPVGAVAAHAIVEHDQAANQELPALPLLDPLVKQGHAALNPQRSIAAGEWWELRDLQTRYGCRQLLIWQARAQRCAKPRPSGIVPAYYVRCAAQDALACLPLPPARPDDAPLPPDAARPVAAAGLVSEAPTRRVAVPQDALLDADEPGAVVGLDSAPGTRRVAVPQDALLDAIEHRAGEPIRKRDALRSASPGLLSAWRECMGHRGMRVRFASPIGFFVKEAAAGRLPPPQQVLDRWAAHAAEPSAALSRAHEQDASSEPAVRTDTPQSDAPCAAPPSTAVAAPHEEVIDPTPYLAKAALLARSSPIAAVAPPAPPVCYCDGVTGYYTTHGPLGLTLQHCPCQLQRDEPPGALRTSDAQFAAFAVERPLAPVSWAGYTFTPDEQRTLLAGTLRAAQDLVERRDRGLCLCGPYGSGKTTLALAAGRALAERLEAPVIATTVQQLVEDLYTEVREKRPSKRLQALIDAPILVLDDLGREKLTDWTRAQLERLIDVRTRMHAVHTPRITIVTTNLSPSALYTRYGPLASRLVAHAETLLCVASDYRLLEQQGGA